MAKNVCHNALWQDNILYNEFYKHFLNISVTTVFPIHILFVIYVFF